MIAEERDNRIVDLVDRNGSMSLVDIAREVGASESTVRRDLLRLHKQGRLRRVRGGLFGPTDPQHGREACHRCLCRHAHPPR